MSLYPTLAAVTLVTIGVLHSILGERVLIRPLLADGRWRVGLRRPHADAIIRFAWHATTIAWFGLAATMFGVEGSVAVTAVAVVSGTIGVVYVTWHLSWPAFLLVALWAALAAGLASRWLLASLAVAAAVLAAGAAAVHVVWATGRAATSAAAALPTTPDGGSVLGRPSPTTTIAVALALATYAITLAALVFWPSLPLVRLAVVGAVVILVLRAAGDGRYVGFSKRVRATRFARLDDALYTPIVTSLAIGGAAALAL
ncbi:DUF3995 domain-containing protein [Nitriliruptor alkaliphilus]|uniref:DUF3995 domain-containing protein n=1 Tax=Nitriliruptor alkaliphilus TaxID=427918 RepID=UPI000697A3CF|nr:DUF3995 domain-containing protein [Nitriliruptor alkaliphilus]